MGVMFYYHCHKDRGGCGFQFHARKPIADPLRSVVCPGCGTTWQQTKKLAGGKRIPIIDYVRPEGRVLPGGEEATEDRDA